MLRVDRIFIEKVSAETSSVAKSQIFRIDLSNFVISVRVQSEK